MGTKLRISEDNTKEKRVFLLLLSNVCDFNVVNVVRLVKLIRAFPWLISEGTISLSCSIPQNFESLKKKDLNREMEKSFKNNIRF